MKLTATKLMYALSGILLLVFIGASSGFYFAQSKLSTYAETITQLNANAEASDKDIETLKKLELKLKDEKDTIESTKAIVSESKQYQYQDQIIKDVISIAASSGVTVTTIDFSAADATGASPSPAAATPPAAGASPVTPGMPGGAAATPAPSAVKSVVTNVTIKNPVKYETLLKFIQAIESNRMKMQIAKVSITADKDGGVSSQSFAIEVYTR